MVGAGITLLEGSRIDPQINKIPSLDIKIRDSRLIIYPLKFRPQFEILGFICILTQGPKLNIGVWFGTLVWSCFGVWFGLSYFGVWFGFGIWVGSDMGLVWEFGLRPREKYILYDSDVLNLHLHSLGMTL